MFREAAHAGGNDCHWERQRGCVRVRCSQDSGGGRTTPTGCDERPETWEGTHHCDRTHRMHPSMSHFEHTRQLLDDPACEEQDGKQAGARARTEHVLSIASLAQRARMPHRGW